MKNRVFVVVPCAIGKMVADCAMADRAARGFVMQYFEIIAM
ncbi:MAG TPA: hypothetical protein PLI94_01680 [Bacillota bacterium]|jgi:hypothetical protein|nr:hypothetical protein [Bacillota bacterium]HPT66730.1 hypothetical protein [Bacillota bacterium]